MGFRAMSKIYSDAVSALDGVLFGGMIIMSGGFDLCGNPEHPTDAVLASGIRELTVISNNCAADGFGLWKLLNAGRIRKMISSYIGENRLFAAFYLEGKLGLELAPQGTLAERIRVGGAGIPAFYNATVRERWWQRVSSIPYSVAGHIFCGAGRCRPRFVNATSRGEGCAGVACRVGDGLRRAITQPRKPDGDR